MDEGGADKLVVYHIGIGAIFKLVTDGRMEQPGHVLVEENLPDGGRHVLVVDASVVEI